jgi:hypothetical protein
MKFAKTNIFILVALISGILVITNPTPREYTEFISASINIENKTLTDLGVPKFHLAEGLFCNIKKVKNPSQCKILLDNFRSADTKFLYTFLRDEVSSIVWRLNLFGLSFYNLEYPILLGYSGDEAPDIRSWEFLFVGFLKNFIHINIFIPLLIILLIIIETFRLVRADRNSVR